MRAILFRGALVLTVSLVVVGLTGCVASVPPTITNFVANPSTITPGGNATLTWSSTGATSCTASGGWTGAEPTSGTLSVSPTSTTTYTLICADAGRTSSPVSATVTVAASAQAPTITGFTASPSTITAGSSTNLTGVFANGTGVITPGNIAVTSGTAVSVSPTATTTYTLTVSPSSGTAVTQTVMVTVNAASTPTITSFTASPSTITSGTSSNLTGVFANGTGVITPGNITVTSGTAVSIDPTTTTTYTLTVTPTTGTAITQAVTVTVNASVPAPTVTITANPTPITSGSSSMLTWSSTNATSCMASNGWSGTEPTSGTQSVSPTSTATYTLTCTGAGGMSAPTSVTVTVNPASTPTITSFTASPTTIASGSSSGLTAVFANGMGVITPGSIAVTSGTAVNVSPTATTTYTLTVTPTTGTAIMQTVTVTVNAASTPTITSFVASPSTIISGSGSSLTADFANGTGVITPGNISVTSGTAVSVDPTTTTTYTLTVTPTTGTAITQMVTVTVDAVSACSSLGPPGVWVNVTPRQLEMDQWVEPTFQNGLNPGNVSLAQVLAGYSGPIATYGANRQVVDPYNPGTVYLGTSSLGIWKTTDCGVNWTHINTGNNGPYLDAGRNWTMVMDPTNSQVLYTTAGYTGGGVWRSTDGGVDWEEILHDGETGTYAGSTVPYVDTGTGGFIEKITLDPTNHNHLLVSIHDDCTGAPLPGASLDGSGGWGCMAQTFNAYAGVAPTDTSAPSWSLTTSGFPWTGADGAGQTMLNATTWFFGTNGYNGLWRTTTGGVSPDGVSSAWTEVIPNTSGVMGGVYYASDGTLYSDGGQWGMLFHSTDLADLGDVNKWTSVSNPNNPFLSTGATTDGVPYIDDGTTVYVSSAGDPLYTSFPLSSPDSIAPMTPAIPAEMTLGGWAFDFDFTNHILYSSNQYGGFWRLVTQAPSSTQIPAITIFSARPATITSGTSTNLTAIFANGTGVITPGNIPVISGTGVSVSPAATTTYTLTVTPTTGSAITQTVTVTVN